MDSARLYVKKTIHVYDENGKFKETKFVCSVGDKTEQTFKHISDVLLITKIETKDRENAKGHS
ncbi:hypothetical protein FACS1894109_20920 [Spirochaetia bacterium]|nr:hypothetical protein FACS1894109_20920 [Spirochaetia bacterium]